MLQQRSRTKHKIQPMVKTIWLRIDKVQLTTEALIFVLKKKYQFCIAESRHQIKYFISTLVMPPQLALLDLGLSLLPCQAAKSLALNENFRPLNSLKIERLMGCY